MNWLLSPLRVRQSLQVGEPAQRAGSPYKLSASTNSILKPDSINSVIISDANSIFVLYLSDSFSVPLGLNTFTLHGNVIL